MEEDHIVNVLDLSDEELFKKLKDYGFPVGPIVGSTRSFYQKRLADILKDGYVARTDYGNSTEEENDGSDMEEEETVRQRVHHQVFSPLAPASGSPSGASFRKTMRQADDDLKPTDFHHSPRIDAKSSPAFSTTKLLIVLIVLVILIVLLYQNMDGTKDSNPVPKIKL